MSGGVRTHCRHGKDHGVGIPREFPAPPEVMKSPLPGAVSRVLLGAGALPVAEGSPEALKSENWREQRLQVPRAIPPLPEMPRVMTPGKPALAGIRGAFMAVDGPG